MKKFQFLTAFRKSLQMGMLLTIVAFACAPTSAIQVLAASPAPANDNYDSATVVQNSDIPFSDTVDTTGATVDTNDPQLIDPNSCHGEQLNELWATVWYKFHATADGLISVDTVGSYQDVIDPNTGIPYPYDTVLSVWTWGANPTDNLQLVECNDDNSAGYVSQLGFNAVAGTDYYIQAGQYNGQTNITPYVKPPYQGGTLKFHIGYGNQVDVYIGNSGTPKGSYSILSNDRVTPTYPGTSDGPVRVISTNSLPLITSERAYRDTTQLRDFNEMMGFPANQLTTEYWFPWYDSTSFMNTYLVIGNASTDNVNQPSASVDVYLAGAMRAHYSVPYGGREIYFDSGMADGPVRVVSTNAVPIITSERAYRDTVNLTDFNEMMGFPASQLTTEYWFPWYDGTSFMNTYLVIGNASTDSVNQPSATVEVYVAGSMRNSYVVPYGGRQVFFQSGLADGPVQVVSTNAVPIITSERAYRNTTQLRDFNEMMGFPANQLTTQYWFPWYDASSFMQTYLVIGNASTDNLNQPSATVDVYVAGNKRASYTVAYGGRAVYFDSGLANGPVKAVSTNAVPIITSERDYRGANLTDFSEMLGYPDNQLTTEYWFPWYDFSGFMHTYMVIGNTQ